MPVYSLKDAACVYLQQNGVPLTVAAPPPYALHQCIISCDFIRGWAAVMPGRLYKDPNVVPWTLGICKLAATIFL